MIQFDILGAFLVGLMGAAHCFGMCGGLIGAFSTNLPNQPGNQLANQLKFLLSYNFGRITSYTLAGCIVGASSAALGKLFLIDDYILYLRFFAGFMMILTGLYIAQLWFGIVYIEKLGKGIWLILQPLSKKVLPIKHPSQAVIAGLIWGWLPCGLVYSTLTWSVASGSAIQGGLIMLAFGAGTLPALVTAGLAAKTLANWVQHKAVKLFSGLLLICFGLHTIFVAFNQL
ncbi:sulfite exporter TauE/SafE family protein [Shewanella gaetbuli]|uniref:Sulfite exporter TauE/SafE family protein n=1 Tax=Shewanella gaetbuli TaxID=220752 RepID=A0A9X2CJZ2_9GAMM|nr:sulfite exporter TauE/SafE family protein [Shewanella gaetbuli]